MLLQQKDSFADQIGIGTLKSPLHDRQAIVYPRVSEDSQEKCPPFLPSRLDFLFECGGTSFWIAVQPVKEEAMQNGIIPAAPGIAPVFLI